MNTRSFFVFSKDVFIARRIGRFGRRRPLGYAFAVYETQKAADAALEQLQNLSLDGRDIKVTYAYERSAEAHETEHDEVEGEEGAQAPRRRRAPRRRTNRRAQGENEVAEASEEHIEAEPKIEKVSVKAARPPRPVKVPLSERTASKTTVYVSNLPFSTTTADLEAFIKSVNAPVPVKTLIVERRFRGEVKSKGFAFVEFKSEHDQAKAVEVLNGKELEGRALQVKVAMDDPRKSEEAKEE